MTAAKTILWTLVLSLLIFFVLAFTECQLNAQTRVYTNEDLGKKMSSNRPTVPPEVLQGMAARQFRSVPERPGPMVSSTGAKAPTPGPWDWPEPRPERRLDGTLLSDPVSIYGLTPFPYFPYPFAPQQHQHGR